MEKERTEKMEKFWSAIGKFGTLLGIIWLAIQVISHFTTPKAGLIGQGKVFPFLLPPAVEIENFGALPRQVWYLEIENRGNLQADSVKLRFPEKALFGVTTSNREADFRKSEKGIELGDLGPGEKAEVVIWPSWPVSSWESNEIKLIHKSGYGSIIFLEFAHPFWARLEQFFSFFAFPVIIPPLFISLLFVLSRIVNPGRSRDKSLEDTPK